MMFLLCLLLMISEAALGQYDLGQLLVNDKVWIDSYRGFWTVKDRRGQDFYPTSTANMVAGTHSELLSLKILDAPVCNFHKLLSLDGTSDLLLYVVRCDASILAFDMNLKNQTAFKFKASLPAFISTTDVLMDAAYYDAKIAFLFKATPDLPNSLKVAVINTIDLQFTTAGPISVADNAKKLTRGRILLANYTVSSSRRLFMVVYEAPLYTELDSSSKANYYAYFFDTTSISTAPAYRDLPVDSKKKLLTMEAWGSKLHIGHHNSATNRVKVAVCTVSPDLNILCVELLTGFVQTAGTIALAGQSSTTIGAMYLMETTNPLYPVATACRMNYEPPAGVLADSNCVYSKSDAVPESNLAFHGFQHVSLESAVAVMIDTSNSLFVRADWLSTLQSQSSFMRRRFRTTFQASWGNTLIIVEGNRARVLNEVSFPDIMLTGTGLAANLAEEAKQFVLATNTSSSITVGASVKTLLEPNTLNVLPDTVQGSTGFFLQLPFSRQSVLENQVDCGATTPDADTTVLHINSATFSLDANQIVDRGIVIGDSLIGIQNNLTNRTFLKYFACNRALAPAISYQCNFMSEVEINGVARSQFIYDLGVSNGSIDKNQPFPYVQDSIVKVKNFDDNLLVFTKDNMTSQLNTVVIAFKKRSKVVTRYNFTTEVRQIDVLDYRKDLYLSGTAASAAGQLTVWFCPDFNVGQPTVVSRQSLILEANDLCVRGSGLTIKTTPRLRFISQCAALDKVYFLERELVSVPNKPTQTLFNNMADFAGNPLINSNVEGCLLGNYYVFWQTNLATLWGIGGHKTDRMAVNLGVFGITSFRRVFCFSHSSALLVYAESGTDRLFFVITSEAARRNPFYIKVAAPVDELVVSETEGRELFLSYKTSAGYVNTRLDLAGPTVFVRANVSSSATRTTISVKNSLSQATVTKDQLSAFSAVSLSVKAERVGQQSMSAKEFNVEQMYKITGPVFRVDPRGFDAAKAVVYPRLYLNQTLTGSSSYSKYKVKFQVGARLEFNNTKSYLLIYKDPQTLRANLSLDFYVDDPLAVTSDPSNAFAYSICEGFDGHVRTVFIHKTSLVPTVLTAAKGAIPVESSSTDLGLTLVKANLFMVTRYNRDTGDFTSSLHDFSGLSASDWVVIPTSAKSRLSRSSPCSPSRRLQPHHTGGVLRRRVRRSRLPEHPQDAAL